MVTRIQAGDRSAAATLFEWYGERLYRQVILPRLPNRELAEDVLKDSFRRALENIAKFEVRDRSIFFWLRRIAINRAMDIHRNQKRDRCLPQESAQHSMSTPPPAPDRGPEMEETRILVERALSGLNPRYATALRLRLLEERDRQECADIMEVKVGNFDVILHRACIAFRNGYPPDMSDGDDAS